MNNEIKWIVVFAIVLAIAGIWFKEVLFPVCGLICFYIAELKYDINELKNEINQLKEKL